MLITEYGFEPLLFSEGTLDSREDVVEGWEFRKEVTFSISSSVFTTEEMIDAAPSNGVFETPPTRKKNK